MIPFLENGLETEGIEFFLEWVEAHPLLLRILVLAVLGGDVLLILFTLMKKEWILNQIKEHDRMEKLFIISFFATAIGGVSSLVVAFGFLGLQQSKFFLIFVLLTAVLFLVTFLALIASLITFVILFVRLFILMKPTLPIIHEEVNWGGTPILVVALAFFAVSLPVTILSESAGSLAGSLVFVAFPLFLVLKTYKRSLDSLKFRKPLVNVFLYTLPLILVLYFGNELVYRITEKFIGEFPLDELVEDIIERSPIFMSINVGVIGPIGEEVFFRGFAHTALKRKYGFRKGILLSSLFFGVYHGIPWQIPYAFVAGLILAYVYEKTQSIYSPILFHIINNSIGVIGIWM